MLKLTNFYFLSSDTSDQENKDTLFSSILKVDEKKMIFFIRCVRTKKIVISEFERQVIFKLRSDRTLCAFQAL